MAPKVATKATKAKIVEAEKPVVESEVEDQMSNDEMEENDAYKVDINHFMSEDEKEKKASDTEVEETEEEKEEEEVKEKKTKEVKEKKTKEVKEKKTKDVKEKKQVREKKTKATKVEKKESESDADNEDESEGKSKKEKKGSVPVDLIKQMMEDPNMPSGMTIKAAKAICECYMRTVFEKVKQGESVTLTNWMTFKRALRAERTHYVPSKENPTAEKKKIVKPAHYVMTIDVKPALKAEFEEIETA